jgi:hypothetical protein
LRVCNAEARWADSNVKLAGDELRIGFHKVKRGLRLGTTSATLQPPGIAARLVVIAYWGEVA